MKWFLVLAVLLIAGCTSIGSGTVVDKRHIPAHSTVETRMIGKLMLPTTVRHPDKWAIQVSDGKNRQWVTVTENEYNGLVVGDYWSGK